MTKGVDERIVEGVLHWVSHMERMDNFTIANRVYVAECASSCSVGRPQKRWTDTVKDWLMKRGLELFKQGEWDIIGVNCGVL